MYEWAFLYELSFGGAPFCSFTRSRSFAIPPFCSRELRPRQRPKGGKRIPEVFERVLGEAPTSSPTRDAHRRALYRRPTDPHFFSLPRLSGFGNGFVQVGFFQLWGFFFLRGVLPTVGFFFLLSAFRIWKQGRAGGVFFPRLSGFGNRVVQGGVSSLGFPDLETGFMQGGVPLYAGGVSIH